MTWKECACCDVPFIASRRRLACPACRQTAAWRNGNYRRLSVDYEPRTGYCKCGVQLPTLRRVKCDECTHQTRAAARRRAKLRRKQLVTETETYTLREIAERDSNRCSWCGKRVRMTAKVPHPRAPVIDHVLPIALGGQDTRANVQLMHFLCNSIKSSSGTDQLRLIG